MANTAFSGVGGGRLVQTVNFQTGAVNTGTTTIPRDDTIPQNTEGDEYMTLAITPTSANSILKIDVTVNISTLSGASILTAALFQDSTADALATAGQHESGGSTIGQVNFTHYMTAGTTNTTTFKVRANGEDATTYTFNGEGGTRRWGGTCASSITISEIGVGTGNVEDVSGRTAQVVHTETGAVATGTTTVPHDDTIPQNTEGDEYLNLSITPTSATNKLRIDVNLHMSHSAANNQLVAALFQDGTVDALAVSGEFQASNAAENVMTLTHYMDAGSTTTETFRVRAGSNQAGTTTVNGVSGSRRYGGAFCTSMTITEIGPGTSTISTTTSKVLQVVNTFDGSFGSGTTQIPNDNTIPQQTEGDEYMTAAITPTSATNKIRIDVAVMCGTSGGAGNVAAALFKDSGADAIAVGSTYDAGGVQNCIYFSFLDTANTTSSITYKLRGGPMTGVTFNFNGNSGNAKFNGKSASSITLTEIEA
jgi:hypothetical protein